MSNKKFIAFVGLFVFLIVGFVGIVNYMVDPFYQYRKSTFYKPFYGGDERYKNPGFAKNFDFNSIIIGSSMTENFLISKTSEIMINPIKLCISGGTGHEIFLTLNTAFETDKNIDTVLLGFDIYAISGKVDRLGNGDGSVPLFLYDKNYLNDYLYLLSIDTLVNSGKGIIRPIINKNDILYNYENMYQWQHNYEKEFGRNKVLAKVKDTRIDKKFNKDDWRFEILKNSFDSNLLSIAKKKKDTKFIFFYPPYSIITYKDWEEKGILEDILNFKKYAFGELNKLNNVEIYDFQSAADITTNLDNYKDYTHYHQNINSWMIDQIKVKNYLVTKDNIDQHLKNLKTQIKAYELIKTK